MPNHSANSELLERRSVRKAPFRRGREKWGTQTLIIDRCRRKFALSQGAERMLSIKPPTPQKLR